MVLSLADGATGSGLPLDSVPVIRSGVLLVGPTTRTRDLLAAYLTASGFAVCTAESGVQAFDVYIRKLGGVDAVIVDVELAELRGLAFIARFRRHFPGVPVFTLTDDPFGPLAVELAETGTAVIAKPVHLRQFADALRSALSEPSSR